MAIKSLEERKKQNVLLIIVLVIFVAALIILYFAFWQKKTPSTTGLEQPESSGQLSNVLEEKLKKIDLDTEFLIEKIIPFLKSHGDLPVRKGITGKPNPFAP